MLQPVYHLQIDLLVFRKHAGQHFFRAQLLQKHPIGEEAFFMGVFNIRGQIGNIVRSLQNVTKRVAASAGLRGGLYFFKHIPVGIKIAEFFIFYIPAFFIDFQRRNRIFDDRA